VKEVLAVDNTAAGLAVLLGPLCLAIIVLVAIEMTDRIPYPADAAGTHPPERRRREPEKTVKPEPLAPPRASRKGRYYRAMSQSAERRLTVTVSAKGIGPKRYEVLAATELDAETKAANRFLEENPGLTEFDLDVQVDPHS
jgi:hypothetical protein